MSTKHSKTFQFRPDGTVEISDDVDQRAIEVTAEQHRIADQVARTFNRYMEAAERLASTTYAHIKELIPAHLAKPSSIFVVGCPNGLVVRFERSAAEPGVMFAWHGSNLSEIVPPLSQGFVRCFEDEAAAKNAPPPEPTITMRRENQAKMISEDFGSISLSFDAIVAEPRILPTPPSKPYCLLSVRDSLEIYVHGVLNSSVAPNHDEQEFVLRSTIRLPVGWQAFEVYPFLDIEAWKPEYASGWAERDILAAVVAHQSREAAFQSLDPNSEARRQFADVLKAFKELLDSIPLREELLQKFLEEHPNLIVPAHVAVWPKLAFGNRKTDFVFREASGEYVLVELEPSTDRLFVKDGHASAELNHAVGQIADWKRYLEDNLHAVQRELGLPGISTSPRSIVVIGRSQSLSHENRRKLATMQNESPKLRILTYDDLYDNAKAVIENLLGPLWEIGGDTKIYNVGRR